MKKKSYNPFKMWGSWIGAIISFLFMGSFCNLFYLMGSFGELGCFSDYFSFLIIFFFPYSLFIIGIIGFLVGWAVNSLWRRFR